MRNQDREYISGLFPAIDKIRDGELREKVIQTWYHAWKRGTFQSIEQIHQFEPLRNRIDYSNVDHTNQVVQACEVVSRLLGDMFKVHVNMDHLFAGAVLHDVDKAVIFDAEAGGLTKTGKKFPHTVMGATMALMEGLPEEVAHVIGAHSIKYSAVHPMSIEALIVRYVDHLVGESAYLAQGLNMKSLLEEQ